MGVWSFGLSAIVGVVFVSLLPSVRTFAIAQNNGTSDDAPGLSLLILFGGLVLISSISWLSGSG
jgi:hypothetical protein